MAATALSMKHDAPHAWQDQDAQTPSTAEVDKAVRIRRNAGLEAY
jgi:hypothetical protein